MIGTVLDTFLGITSSGQPYDVGNIIVLSYQMRQQRLRKIKSLSKAAQSGELQGQDWNPGPLEPKPMQTRKQPKAAHNLCQTECKNWKRNTLQREEGACCGLGQEGMCPSKHVTARLPGTGTGNQSPKCLVCFSEPLLCLFTENRATLKRGSETLRGARGRAETQPASHPSTFLFGSKVGKHSEMERATGT